MIRIIYKGERGDMGQGHVTFSVVADRTTILEMALEPAEFISYDPSDSGRDYVGWGTPGDLAANAALLIAVHLLGWPIDPKTGRLAQAQQRHLAKLYTWLALTARPGGFTLTDAGILGIMWPERFSWSKWIWRVRLAWLRRSWLRILALRGSAALRLAILKRIGSRTSWFRAPVELNLPWHRKPGATT
jgi:hypothetical protein